MPVTREDALPRLCMKSSQPSGERTRARQVIHTRNLTSNVQCAVLLTHDTGPVGLANLAAGPAARSYSSSMCSKGEPPGQATTRAADVAERLARAIDECAAAAYDPGWAAEPELAGRLAALWAMLTDADPDLADRAARYSGS